METDAYRFELKIEDPLKLVGRLTCKQCGKTTAFQGPQLTEGSVLKCPCGQLSITLAGDDLADMQAALDRLKAQFKKLGNIKLGG